MINYNLPLLYMYIESVMVWNNKGNIVRIILISQEETIVRDEEVYCNPIYLNVDRSSPLHWSKTDGQIFSYYTST